MKYLISIFFLIAFVLAEIDKKAVIDVKYYLA